MPSEPREIWATALGELQVQLPRANFDTWLKGTEALSLQENELLVAVPSPFVAEWLEKHLSAVIQQTVSRIARRPLAVKLAVAQEPPGNHAQASKAVAPCPQGQMPLLEANGLNPRYSFEGFAVGPSNQLAYAAAVSVAEKPGAAYNPLFIHSGPGLGKTHLLQAIGLKATGRKLSCLYVSSEQFTNDFVSSIASRRMGQFRDKYRTADILMVDDIQFISGKEGTQESFFHTFNFLHNINRQVVLASDRPPSDMELLENRLRSRFEGGLIVDIQPPELETRMVIIQLKAKERRLELEPAAAAFLAQEAFPTVRALEGLLNKAAALARLQGTAISLETAQTLVATKRPRNLRPKGEAILEAVAAFFELPVEDVIGRARNKRTTQARNIAMYLLREDSRQSVKQIGKTLGDRDHSTVVHAYRKIATQAEQDGELNSVLQSIRQLISTKMVA